jgi:hypothetical protein
MNPVLPSRLDVRLAGESELARTTRDARDSWIAKWHRYLDLPRFDRGLVLQAIALLPLTFAGLQFMGFQRWTELIHASTPLVALATLPGPDETLSRARRIARAVRSAEMHGVMNPLCLERSLVLWWMLRAHGIDSELHVGGRKVDSRFEAHAWVELHGHVLNDSLGVHAGYARFEAPLAAAVSRR